MVQRVVAFSRGFFWGNNQASLVNIPSEAFSCSPAVNVLPGHLISKRGSFSATNELTDTVVQCTISACHPYSEISGFFFLGALAGENILIYFSDAKNILIHTLNKFLTVITNFWQRIIPLHYYYYYSKSPIG